MEEKVKYKFDCCITCKRKPFEYCVPTDKGLYIPCKQWDDYNAGLVLEEKVKIERVII